MAIRYSVQSDNEAECRQGLELLCHQLGLEPAMRPRLMTDDRWMARAVPRTTKTPTDDGRGPVVRG